MNMKFVVVVLLMLLLGMFLGMQMVKKNDATALSINVAPTGGDFVLQSKYGEFDLKDYRGKLVLIYFGYTFCPDICPTNLSHLTQALNELNETELSRIQPIFLSVDPERDSLDHLDNYVKYFHKSLIGVTGDELTIATVAKKFGAAYQKVTGESEGGYLIDHSSFTYLVDQKGQLKESFPHASDPLLMVKTIRNYLNN
ncbi:MAG: SCO family protein [Gammaproteobacteria bacterium]|nr:SCO family protein [Gammaproteobacteria bacterium]